MEELPVIDVAALVAAGTSTDVAPAESAAAAAIDRACRDRGFFLVTGHGIDPGMFDDLDRAAREFFALDDREKAAIAMATGGAAWRGWFPVGGELTSGKPDHKEGLYLGVDLPGDDPRVLAGTPLHGPNRYPEHPKTLQPAVEAWLGATITLGHAIVRGLGLALGLGPRWFDEHLTEDPTVLARIFRYPGDTEDRRAGVPEHTDYGLLTMLAHDGRPGLEVRGGQGWLPVPHVPGALVVNLGDMVEAMTGGRYRSTPHRVTLAPGVAGDDRLSFPLFFDPAWTAHIAPLPLDHLEPATRAEAQRWDGTTVERWEGRYGDYLTTKVEQVFPDLFADVFPTSRS